MANCEAVGDGQKALLYLGGYLYRGVIQEADILRCHEHGNVTIEYRGAKTGKLAQRTLPGTDFLWLVLQHGERPANQGNRMKHFPCGFGYLATVTRWDLAAGRNELRAG